LSGFDSTEPRDDASVVPAEFAGGPHDVIIDIRCRYVTRDSAKYFGRLLEIEGHESPESYFEWLDECGVQTALSPTAASLGLELGRWNLPPRIVDNDEQAELQRKYPRRFIGVAGIDPGNVVHDGLRELERCVKELGLRVATIEPGRKPLLAPNPADRRLYDFYGLAEQLEVPVILQTSGLKGGVTIDYAHPRWIDQVAHDFPDLNIICAHGCVPFMSELGAVLWRRPNVYTSPGCYTFTNFRACRWYHPGQMIFGSAYPFAPVRDMIQLYLAAFWGRMKLDDIMYRNAIRALRLERDPFFASMLEKPRVFGPSDRFRARIASLVGLRRRIKRIRRTLSQDLPVHRN
jgi:predicted TIM-barrel fold metal-dependent hydrolase